MCQRDHCQITAILFISIASMGVLVSMYAGIHSNYFSHFNEILNRDNLDINKDKRNKEYPISTIGELALLFSTFNIITETENQVNNFEIERDVAQILNESLHYKAIYLVNGESGIGKSTAFQKVLNNIKKSNSLNYIFIDNGFEELVEKIAPDFNKDSKYPLFRVIRDALNQYSAYRKSRNLKKNALIILDNTNKISKPNLMMLKDIAKYFVDKSQPIVFIFLSSEGKVPSFLMDNMSRITVMKLKEPSSQVAFEYFKKIGVNPSYFEKLENITGGAFKYLTQIPLIDPSMTENEFFEG